MVTKLSRRATDMREPVNALAEEGHVPPRQTWPTGCCDRSVDAQWTRGVCEQAHRRSGTETGGTIYQVEVEDSLRRLGTDYLDLLYLHAWDDTTGVDEVMRGFDDLVRSGKVLLRP